MIFKYELADIEHICKYTNILIDFETDNSIRERFVEHLLNTIDVFQKNRFKYVALDSSYEEFNKIIDLCIETLKKKIELVKCGRNIPLEKIKFDESKYEPRVVK